MAKLRKVSKKILTASQLVKLLGKHKARIELSGSLKKRLSKRANVIYLTPSPGGCGYLGCEEIEGSVVSHCSRSISVDEEGVVTSTLICEYEDAD